MLLSKAHLQNAKLRCVPNSIYRNILNETARDNCYSDYMRSIIILSDELKKLPSHIKKLQSKIERRPEDFREFEEDPKYKLEVVTFDKRKNSASDTEDLLKYVKDAVNIANSKLGDKYKFIIFNADKNWLSVQFVRNGKK